MKRKQYPFHPDLKQYEKMCPPVMPKVVPVLQKLMGVLYRQEKSDGEVDVSALKVPGWKGAENRALLYAPHGTLAEASVGTPREKRMESTAEGQKLSPCLLFFHGGGFVYNAAPHHFALARRLAKALGWKVLLLDYRLAPRYKYPTAPEDCFAAYSWLLENGASLGIDPKRIAVCGDSAGGNLAAVLCLMARERNVQMPMAQMLLYPVTDQRMITESVKTYTDTPMCNSRDMEKYMTMYLKQDAPEKLAYLSVAERQDLEGLPPAYLETAEFDCLHDEGAAYGEALRRAGVEAESHEVKGAMHGYDIAQDSGLVKELMEQRTAFFKRADGSA